MSIDLATSACCFHTLDRTQLLDSAASAGFSSVELFCDWPPSGVKLDPEIPEDFSHTFSVSALHLPNNRQQALAAIDFAARSRIPCVIAHGAGTPRDAAEWLKPLVYHAATRGVEIVLTNHKGQSIESPDDVQMSLDACGQNAPFVLLEAGHYWAAGHDPVAAFSRFQQRVRLIHIKDLDAGGRSAPFGSGVSPLDDFIGAVVRAGYCGRIVLELEIANTDPAKVTQYLSEGRAKIAAMIAEAASASRSFAS